MSYTAQLPRWDLTPIFPALDSQELDRAASAFASGVDDLVALFDSYVISRLDNDPLAAAPVAVFEDVTVAYNELLAESWRLETYCYAQVAVDAGNAAALARLSEHERQADRLTMLQTRFSAWLATLDLDALIARSPLAADHAGPLRALAESARYQMSPGEESLASDLNSSGAAAWERLYEQIWSSLTVDVELDGERQALSMSQVRLLAFDANRETRWRAYAAELRAWRSASVPLAAALNGVKGHTLTRSARSGWPSPLDEARAVNRIDHETLDALRTTAGEAFPDFRRYLRAKAAALGLEQLAWYDLLAPVGGARREWEYATARDFILREFGNYSAELRGLAERAFREHWLDIEPRPGKQGGAFCLAVGDGTSRIMSNFIPAFGEVRTLAHELGHAYHHHVQHQERRTMLQQILTPMTLAETASTFCETLIRQAALDDAEPSEQLTMLDAALQNHCRFVVDVSAGFLVEQRIFAARRERELSVEELNTLMVAAQLETYGEAIDPDTFHPFMWAYRPHYFSASSSFTSFPYMFGLLFGLGLYARYRQDPAGFRVGFDDLLAATGEIDPTTLAARFEIDIRTPAFWRSSLAVIRGEIDRFERLVAES